MSAYICDDYHLSALACAITRLQYTTVKESAEEVAKLLFAENCKSVNYRYNDSGNDSFLFDNSAYTSDHSAVELIKAVQCYDYQACEHPEWENSRAKELVDGLKAEQLYKLAGYEEAEWGLAKSKYASANVQLSVRV